MLAVYIILAIIFILFITVIILAIRKYNNEEVEKELEYISENYDVNDINNTESIESNVSTSEIKSAPAQGNTTVTAEPTITIAKPEEFKPKVVEEQKVDNTPPPVIELKVGEQTDEEITIEDTAIKEEPVSESIEVKDNALVGSESGEEIQVVDTSLKVEEAGEEAVTIKEEEPTPPPVEVKQEVDYSNQAFGNNFDGNNTINRDIKIEAPKQDVSMKTEIWDFSEIQNGGLNEKN